MSILFFGILLKCVNVSARCPQRVYGEHATGVRADRVMQEVISAVSLIRTDIANAVTQAKRIIWIMAANLGRPDVRVCFITEGTLSPDNGNRIAHNLCAQVPMAQATSYMESSNSHAYQHVGRRVRHTAQSRSSM